MKKQWVFIVMAASFASVASTASAKLSDKIAMKCISDDKSTKSAFLDLEQAYEMRSVTAKDFFNAFDKSASCPDLRKNIRKLHGDMIARMPLPAPKGRAASEGSDWAPAPTQITTQNPDPAYRTPPPPDFDEDGPAFLE